MSRSPYWNSSGGAINDPSNADGQNPSDKYDDDKSFHLSSRFFFSRRPMSGHGVLRLCGFLRAEFLVTNASVSAFVSFLAVGCRLLRGRRCSRQSKHASKARHMPDSSTVPPNETKLLDRREVASLLGCSARQIQRLEADEAMPPAVRIGRRLVRWRRQTIEQWIGEGCPSYKRGGTAE